MEINCVSPFHVNMVYSEIFNDICSAIQKTGGHIKAHTIWNKLLVGDCNLLLFYEPEDPKDIKIAVIGTFEEWDGTTVFHANLVCKGSVSLWKENLGMLKQWAQAHGAEKIILAGQQDVYSRVFKEEGIKKVYTVYEMEI
jgi:hypothetical protein